MVSEGLFICKRKIIWSNSLSMLHLQLSAGLRHACPLQCQGEPLKLRPNHAISSSWEHCAHPWQGEMRHGVNAKCQSALKNHFH